MKSALEGRLVSDWVACYTLIIMVSSMSNRLQGHTASSRFAGEAAEVQGLGVACLPAQLPLTFFFCFFFFLFLERAQLQNQHKCGRGRSCFLSRWLTNKDFSLVTGAPWQRRPSRRERRPGRYLLHPAPAASLCVSQSPRQGGGSTWTVSSGQSLGRPFNC